MGAMEELLKGLCLKAPGLDRVQAQGVRSMMYCTLAAAAELKAGLPCRLGLTEAPAEGDVEVAAIHGC